MTEKKNQNHVAALNILQNGSISASLVFAAVLVSGINTARIE